MSTARLNGSRAALALAVAGLMACSAKPPPAEPLTSIDVGGAVGLFVVTTAVPTVTWYQLMADGTFKRASTHGTTVTSPEAVGAAGGQLVTTIPVPLQIVAVSPGLAMVRFASWDLSSPDQAYFRHGMLLETRTGRLVDGWRGAGFRSCGWAPGCDWPAWSVQALPDGTLAVLSADLAVAPVSVYAPTLDGSAWEWRWPLTPVGRTTDWFAADAAGNLAIRGPVIDGPPTFIPAIGPMVESPLAGTFGDFWTGPDGAIRSTRLVGDAAGTVELIRFDFPLTGAVTATATASWTGTGLLTGWPTTMGASTVFMVGTQPLVFETPDAAPVLHPALGITWTQVQATATALWFTAGTSDSGSLVRWTRAGAAEVRPEPPWTYLDLFPIADDDVLIQAWNPVEGKGAVLRSTGTSAPAPIDLGVSPVLRGHVRWK